MVAIALLAAVGFFISNRDTTGPSPTQFSKQRVQPAAQSVLIPAPNLQATSAANEDVVTYIPAEIAAILHEALSSVPLATVEEAMMGCYGTMGAAAPNSGGKSKIRPFQTDSLDEVLGRTTEAISAMENEQHISKFTISTQGKSKANPHVDVFAHCNEPKRIRLIRFWRTQEGFITTLPLQ
jgi:hypothetical protein